MARARAAVCAMRMTFRLASASRSAGRMTARQGSATSGSAAIPARANRWNVATALAGARPSNSRAATHGLSSTSRVGPATSATDASLISDPPCRGGRHRSRPSASVAGSAARVRPPGP